MSSERLPGQVVPAAFHMATSIRKPETVVLSTHDAVEIELSNRQPTDQALDPAHRVVEKTSLIHEPRVTPKAIARWWSFYINPNLVCQDVTGHTVHDPRDFLALERTYLSYLRTSNTLAQFGVVIAQLFILQNVGFGYGRGLAVCIFLLAILLTTVSATRVLRMQNKIIAGRMVTNAHLFLLAMGLLIALLIALLIINNMR